MEIRSGRRLAPASDADLDALNMTAEGRLWLANLNAHVCVIEHGRRAMGPNAARPIEEGLVFLRDFPRR